MQTPDYSWWGKMKSFNEIQKIADRGFYDKLENVEKGVSSLQEFRRIIALVMILLRLFLRKEETKKEKQG